LAREVTNNMIPEEINVLSVLAELQALGWKDYKIEMECEFTRGYVAQIRCGNVEMPAYQKLAKLLNLLERSRVQECRAATG
jgi:transcriptional regulator with XRE-family HTH domain